MEHMYVSTFCFLLGTSVPFIVLFAMLLDNKKKEKIEAVAFEKNEDAQDETAYLLGDVA